MITDANAAVYRSVIDIEITNSTRKLSKIPLAYFREINDKAVKKKEDREFRNGLYKNDAFDMENGNVLMEYINLLLY